MMNPVKNSSALIGKRINVVVFSIFSPAEKLLLLFVMMYFVVCFWAAYTHNVLNRIEMLLYISRSFTGLTLFFSVFVTLICLKVLWWKVTIHPTPLMKVWWPRLAQETLNNFQLIRGVPIFIVLLAFLTLATNMKGLISYYGTYSWDPVLVTFDKKLHFGVDPWRLLQPVLGYPIITSGINFLYNIWFFIMLYFLYWQLFDFKVPRLRLQFFYTFILTWALNGTLLAIVFASGGPCFYEALIGGNYFRELMDYLHEANNHYLVLSLKVQDLLLNMYQEDRIMIGAGISAMPSMHVAMAFLFYLLTTRINKWLGFIFAVYCFLILIGSVHLAWHYAIDGYFSIISTWVYWKLSGLIIDKVEQNGLEI